MNGSYKLEGKYNTTPNEKISQIYIETTFKPLIELDKKNKRIYYVCMQNKILGRVNLIQHFQYFPKDQNCEKVYFNKTHLTRRSNN